MEMAIQIHRDGRCLPGPPQCNEIWNMMLIAGPRFLPEEGTALCTGEYTSKLLAGER